MTIENRLFILMAEKGFRTLTELAKESGAKYRTLFNFANNKAKLLDPELVARLCVTLECEINELLVIKK
jgi:DNA-binding Xre family transcriptional regulator